MSSSNDMSQDKRPITIEVIKNCARCDKDHEHMVFAPLSGDLLLNEQGQPYSHWATCPNTNEPVMLYFEHDEPKPEDPVPEIVLRPSYTWDCAHCSHRNTFEIQPDNSDWDNLTPEQEKSLRETLELDEWQSLDGIDRSEIFKVPETVKCDACKRYSRVLLDLSAENDDEEPHGNDW